MSRRNIQIYVSLEAEDGEGRQATVEFNELAYIFDDDLAVDELQSVEGRHGSRWILDVEELDLDGLVDGALDVNDVLEQAVEVEGCYLTTSERLVEELGGLVEDVTEEAVVDEFVLAVVGVLDVADVAVEEAQLTAQVVADGRRADAVCKTVAEVLHHLGGLRDGRWGMEEGLLAGFEGLIVYS